MPPPRREYRAFPLGNGRYRLITTVTHVTEDIVSEEKLLELGVPVPERDLPWRDEPPKEVVWRRDARSQMNPDLEAALEYWGLRCGSADGRLRSQMPGWVREFGLAPVREAIDIVAAGMGSAHPAVKYGTLVRVFKEMRKRLGGGK